MRTDGLGSTTRRRTLWSTYDQLKLNLAGLAARRVTLWSCWAPRVPRLQVSRGATELLVAYRTDPPTRQVRTKGRRLMCRIRRARGLLNCRSGGGSGMQRGPPGTGTRKSLTESETRSLGAVQEALNVELAVAGRARLAPLQQLRPRPAARWGCRSSGSPPASATKLALLSSRACRCRT
eukprot:scaffold3071_cov59-Phaeocystis_antarctica.AAC.1